jgi:Fe2+ transport system protein B
MLTETAVSAFLEASITGAGLVLAVYALITPLSQRIFTERAKKLQSLIEKFEEEKSKITPDSSQEDFNRLNQLRRNIKEVRIFPRYLGIGILITFMLFMFSAISDGV